MGSGFGTLNSISPTHISDTFGVSNFGKNWGVIIFSAALFAFMFQLLVGKVYEAHAAIVGKYNEH